MNLHSYPKVYNLGHPAIEDLLDGEVVIQEKYDGSQFSWWWSDTTGELTVRSKGAIQYGGPDNRTEPDGIFAAAVAYLRSLAPPILGVVFRGEVFAKPKHNTIAYKRAPRNGIVLFDVEVDPNRFHPVDSLPDYADGLGIEPAKLFYHGPGAEVTLDFLGELLTNTSTLGDVPIEGVVIKNYGRFGRDGKILCGKYVSEAFKEKHKREWKGSNPSSSDIIDQLIQSLNTEARWRKAIQHLRDDGQLEHSPRDIGPLMKEIKADTLSEEREWIAEKLLEWALPKITRGVGSGFPEWYKAELVASQFEEAAS